MLRLAYPSPPAQPPLWLTPLSGCGASRGVYNALMSILYRILERRENAVEVIAEVRDGVVTGRDAHFIKGMLKRYGYPRVPLEEALYRFRYTCASRIGVQRIDDLGEK